MTQQEFVSIANTPCYVDISNEVYHESAGISSSGLKLLAQSPAHYWARYLDPAREARKRTPALVLGDQIHTAVLEPARYFQTYYPLPEKFNRATKQGKADAEYHEAQAADKGQVVITKDNHEICQRLTETVRDNPAADFLFNADGLIEQSFYWTESVVLPDTGEIVEVLCKCRPDKLLTGLNIILDLKSAEDASLSAFQRASFSYGYHISAAFYLRGVEAVLGIRPTAFVIAAFEKESPFACSFFQFDNDALTQGNADVVRLLQRYAECLAADEWPGYPHCIRQISLPNWAVTTQATS